MHCAYRSMLTSLSCVGKVAQVVLAHDKVRSTRAVGRNAACPVRSLRGTFVVGASCPRPERERSRRDNHKHETEAAPTHDACNYRMRLGFGFPPHRTVTAS